MRYFAVLAFAAVASAALTRRQDLTFPDCSNSCLLNADFGSCGATDDECLCNSSDFVNSVTNCIVKACQGNDLTNAESAAQQLCLAAGVTLTAPPTSTPAANNTSSGASAGQTSSSTDASTPSPTGDGGNGAASHGVSAAAALLVVGAAALVF